MGAQNAGDTQLNIMPMINAPTSCKQLFIPKTAPQTLYGASLKSRRVGCAAYLNSTVYIALRTANQHRKTSSVLKVCYMRIYIWFTLYTFHSRVFVRVGLTPHRATPTKTRHRTTPRAHFPLLFITSRGGSRQSK